MRRTLGLGLVIAAGLTWACNPTRDCVVSGGICAATCPAGTQPLSAAQLSSQLSTGDYGCSPDAGSTLVRCCLPDAG